MSLVAKRTNPVAGAGAQQPTQQVAPQQTQQVATPPAQTSVPAVVAQQPQHVAPVGNVAGAIANLNDGILDNIDGLGNAGNYVSMDGSDFLYKATDERVKEIDLIVKYGKRYYQWVEENGENKTFHDSDTKIDDRYKLKFEIKWDEEREEGELTECQFHMPTASAMRFIDYVKALAQSGYGIGNVVTRLSISRQVQKNSTNRYSRAEFTMVGLVNADNEIVNVPNGITTVGKK